MNYFSDMVYYAHIQNNGRIQKLTRKQIIIIAAMGTLLIIGVLFFIFVPKEIFVKPKIVEVEETVYVKKQPEPQPKAEDKNGVSLTKKIEEDKSVIPDPIETKENSGYINFENTIDRLIEVTER